MLQILEFLFGTGYGRLALAAGGVVPPGADAGVAVAIGLAVAVLVAIAAGERNVGQSDAACRERFAGEHLLACVWRIGGRVRLVPLHGRESLFAREDMMGVVINQARRYVA